MRRICADTHSKTCMHTLTPRVCPCCQPSGAMLWSSHCGSTQPSISLISPPRLSSLTLSLSPSLQPSGLLDLTALGCLGSGGIPISSSNHDIISPEWVKDVAGIFPTSFLMLPSIKLHALHAGSCMNRRQAKTCNHHGKTVQVFFFFF